MSPTRKAETVEQRTQRLLAEAHRCIHELDALVEAQPERSQLRALGSAAFRLDTAIRHVKADPAAELADMTQQVAHLIDAAKPVIAERTAASGRTRAPRPRARKATKATTKRSTT